MIKVEVIKEFTLRDFDKLNNIVRKNKEEEGRLFVGDTFECTKEMAEYLTGNNPANEVVVKVIEVFPEVRKESKTNEGKPVKKTAKKTTKKKQ